MDPGTAMLLSALISGGSGVLASLFNKKPKFSAKQVSNYSPEQQRLLRMMTENLTPELMQQLYGPINEGQLRERYQRTTAEPAMQEFREQFVPELQELFTGIGSKGGDLEQYQLATAARKLQEGLARGYEQTYENELAQRRNAVSGALTAQPVSTIPMVYNPSNPMAAFATGATEATGNMFTRWLANQPWANITNQQTTPQTYGAGGGILPEFRIYNPGRYGYG